MSKTVTNNRKKSPPQKCLKIILPVIVVSALKHLATHSSKNSIRVAKGLYEYLDYDATGRRRLV